MRYVTSVQVHSLPIRMIFASNLEIKTRALFFLRELSTLVVLLQAMMFGLEKLSPEKYIQQTLKNKTTFRDNESSAKADLRDSFVGFVRTFLAFRNYATMP